MRVDVRARVDADAELHPDLERHISQRLLQHNDDLVWAERIGPAYTRAQVASLLGVSEQAIAKRSLLALKQRNGRIAYPVMQFDGDRPVAGLIEVVRTLAPVVATTWTIASWLTEPDIGGTRPIDQLHDGEMQVVVMAARRLARAWAR